MTDMSERLAALPAERRAQFFARLRSLAQDAGRRGPVPRGDTGPAPLSHAQETSRFLNRLVRCNPTCNAPLCVRLQGDLDVSALRSALAVVVSRHEALRTAIVEREEASVQVIAPNVSVELPLIEVTNGDFEQRLASARELIDEQIKTRFTLSRTPMWRALLIRISMGDHLFLFDVHPILFDNLSLRLFTDEVSEVYRSLRESDEPQLPHLPLQYPDYAIWQYDTLDNSELDRLAAYWREKLAGAELLEFPTDRPRGDGQTFAGSVGNFKVCYDSLERARNLAQEAGTTLYDVLVAAFFVLLHRYSGQEDLVIGSPDSNRGHDAVSSVIGCFVNMIVLRGDASGDPSFRELVHRVNCVASEARAHGALPLNKVVDAVSPTLDPLRAPIFQIVFTLESMYTPICLPDLVTSEEAVGVGISLFDMRWNLVEPSAPGTDARLSIEFNTDLFDDNSIARFALHYGELLRSLTGAPDSPLSASDMLSPADRAFLAEVCCGPARPVRETTIVEQFEARVEECPNSVAVVVEETGTSYAELNARANRLAALLRERGAGRGTRIGLCLRRNVDVPTAVLAVLKIGAAYVPLDPTHPPARVAEIAADAGVCAIIAHSGVAGTLGDVAAPLVALDDVRADLAAMPDRNPPLAAIPGDVAYVIYTSGSTGKAKGVLLEHRGVVNFIDSTRDLFALTPADRVLGFASMTFDVSVFEMFSALLTGARLCLATDDERLSIDRLQSLMERVSVTVIDLPPAVMPLLTPENFTDLRIAFVGGEAFSGELVNRWNPGRRLFNGYGPTECTVTMIVEECAGTWDASPPIGLPMANHVAHVLDRNLRQVPIGVPGELVIGGAGLARGYLNRVELTEEKFVTDRFGTALGGRLYRTGDLVKRLPDGRLVFLGRVDQQVKIRGLRIELGEVESALAGFTGIGPVSVRPWTDDAGNKHLVGYVTGVSEWQVQSVREHISMILPSYMIPFYFVVLDELPLTTNGKVDWRKLPPPSPKSPGNGSSGEPRTTTERVLLYEVLTPLLRNDRLGVYDDFFQAGGNSLQAAQLIAAINRRFEVEVVLTDFFASPTVAHLATFIDSARAARLSDSDLFDLLENMPGRSGATTDEERRPVLMRPPGPGQVILVHPSGGELFCYMPLIRALRDGIGVVGFAADPRDTAVFPCEAMVVAATRIVRALTTTGLRGSYCLVGWSYGGVLAFEIARQLERDTGARPPVVLLDASFAEDVVPLDESTVRRRFVHDVARLVGRSGPSARAVLDGPADSLVDIRETLASLKVELALSNDELAARYNIFRACALALQSYRPPTPYGGPVTLLTVSPRAAVEDQWRAVCTGRFQCDDLCGDHYTLFAEPCLSRIVAEIERTLAP